MRQRICVVGHLRAAEDAMLRYRLHEKQLEFSHRLLLVCSVHVHACVRASQAVISGAFCLSLSLSTSLTQTNIYISSVFFFIPFVMYARCVHLQCGFLSLNQAARWTLWLWDTHLSFERTFGSLLLAACCCCWWPLFTAIRTYAWSMDQPPPSNAFEFRRAGFKSFLMTRDMILTATCLDYSFVSAIARIIPLSCIWCARACLFRIHASYYAYIFFYSWSDEGLRHRNIIQIRMLCVQMNVVCVRWVWFWNKEYKEADLCHRGGGKRITVLMDFRFLFSIWNIAIQGTNY